MCIRDSDYTFVIDPAALPQPDALADQPYTGSAIEPPVIIAGLLEGRDYTCLLYTSRCV